MGIVNRRSPSKGRTTFLVAVAAFLGGVLADRSGFVPGGPWHEPAGLRSTFAPFWEAWGLVEKHYVDREAVQPVRMTRGAIEGMLDSLGDIGHTTYLSPEQVQEVESGLEGEFEGIGARMTVRRGRPTIVYTFPGSPARAAGLQPGDVLLKVDGKSVADLPLDQIVRLVKGRPGTEVHLGILREGVSSPLEVSITRARVEVPDVTWHLLPGEPAVAHMAIQSFGTHVDEQLRAALGQARRQGARGLILDVRGNPGGLKDQAVAVTSEFLAQGNVFIEQDAKGKRTAVPVQPGGTATDIPAVLLIDEGTASSAEIFAGALQDHGRAKLVGTRTFGTGTVLESFGLSDGSAVLLAVLEWLTPDGREIWHKGIEPDVAVSLPEGVAALLPEEEDGLDAAALAKSPDQQLRKALELLRAQIR
jgi:carboxyl-terminal processing protease